MKNILIISSLVIMGLYLLGNMLGVGSEEIARNKQAVADIQRHENARMIEISRKMHPMQVMKMVQDRMMMTSQMIQAQPANSKMKQDLQNKLNTFRQIQSKEDYIVYLQSGL